MSIATQEKVLIVDDEPQVLVALEDLLSDTFVVFKTTTAQHALNVLERERDVAVVITDERMPAMTGSEFLARLGQSSDALRILLTGFADLSSVVRSVNEGKLFAYVTKPWSPSDLRLRVDRAAEQFRLTRELARERQLLQERTSILNAVLESVGDGVVVSDATGTFLLFNPQAERLLGTTHSATSLADWASACGVYLTDGRTPLPVDHDPIVRGMSERIETELVIRNGVKRRATVAVTATPLRRDGRSVGSVALLHDVTERRLLEQRLSQAQKMEAIGELAGGVAHDFNNLLTVIQSCGELVLERLTHADPRFREMDQLLEAAKRASALTKQLLAIGHHDAARPKMLDLNAVIENIVPMLQRVIGDRIELVINCCSADSMVLADEGQLEQVILNLVINARDAMPRGGSVTIETRDVLPSEMREQSTRELPSGRFVALTVRDTGCGMDAETRRRAFEPFFTTKGPGKGTGLGLSTVYGIVHRSGGLIGMDSELESGTRFDVYLPAANSS
jgi:PAS domain S-box-containing protein